MERTIVEVQDQEVKATLQSLASSRGYIDDVLETLQVSGANKDPQQALQVLKDYSAQATKEQEQVLASLDAEVVRNRELVAESAEYTVDEIEDFASRTEITLGSVLALSLIHI